MSYVQPDYLVTFTASGLLRVSSAQIAELYLRKGDWDAARQEGLDTNLLQTRTPTTGKRIWRELESRLQPLPIAALRLLATSSFPQQSQILWLALCKRYALIREFSVEVLREAALFGKQAVSIGDVESFLHSKSELSVKLRALPSTEFVRVRQVLLRLARESGLVDPQGGVHAMLPDLEVAKALGRDFLTVWPALLLTDAGLREVQTCL